MKEEIEKKGRQNGTGMGKNGGKKKREMKEERNEGEWGNNRKDGKMERERKKGKRKKGAKRIGK